MLTKQLSAITNLYLIDVMLTTTKGNDFVSAERRLSGDHSTHT